MAGLAAAALAAGMPSSAYGQSCSTTTVSGNYGNVDVLPGAAINTTSSFTVTCRGNNNATVRACIEFGTGNGACQLDGSQRTLCNGSNFLHDEFYSDAARTQVWGSWGSVLNPYGTGGVTYDLPLNSSGNGSHTFTAYARVLASQQTAVPGSYSWTTSSPGIRYGYRSGSACPAGGSTTTSSGSTWTATVVANCNVSTANINFGTVGALNANVDATGTLTVQCTNTTPYNVGLNAGNSTGATVTNRKMTSGGGATVNYALYQNSSRTTNWGNTVGTDTVSGTGTGNSQSLTVYGRIAPQATPSPGTYNDTIVVTVTY